VLHPPCGDLGLLSLPRMSSGMKMAVEVAVEHIGRCRFGGTTEVEYFDFNVVIPEPATMSLLALGGVALLRRKK
jgi:hypothetical protein